MVDTYTLNMYAAMSLWNIDTRLLGNTVSYPHQITVWSCYLFHVFSKYHQITDFVVTNVLRDTYYSSAH